MTPFEPGHVTMDGHVITLIERCGWLVTDAAGDQHWGDDLGDMRRDIGSQNITSVTPLYREFQER